MFKGKLFEWNIDYTGPLIPKNPHHCALSQRLLPMRLIQCLCYFCIQRLNIVILNYINTSSCYLLLLGFADELLPIWPKRGQEATGFDRLVYLQFKFEFFICKEKMLLKWNGIRGPTLKLLLNTKNIRAKKLG